MMTESSKGGFGTVKLVKHIITIDSRYSVDEFAKKFDIEWVGSIGLLISCLI